MTESENAHRPPMKESDEATAEQLALARTQGQAYLKALNVMVEEIADTGGEQPAGDYVVAYAIEDAEGLYSFQGDELVWQEPDQENKHFEIALRDGSDDRFVYGATVFMTLIDDQGAELARHELPLLWHPWLPHYGGNWYVPHEGTYDLRVEVLPPSTPRHDEKNGKRYPRPVEVVFEGVDIRLPSG